VPADHEHSATSVLLFEKAARRWNPPRRNANDNSFFQLFFSFSEYGFYVPGNDSVGNNRFRPDSDTENISQSIKMKNILHATYQLASAISSSNALRTP
jgi:hypothetical protein